jgi:hypothetical protein
LKKEKKSIDQNVQTDLVGTFNIPKCNFNVTLGGLTNDSNKMIVTKDEVTRKQNAKRAYIEHQIHFSNFTLARTSHHLNFVQSPAKKSSFSLTI